MPRRGQAPVGERQVRLTSRSLAKSLETERRHQGWVKYPSWPPERPSQYCPSGAPRKDISKRRPRMCRYFEQDVACPYGRNCRYSHSPTTKRRTNRTKQHRSRGARGGRGRKNANNDISLGTQVAIEAVQSLTLAGNVKSARKLVLELNK